MKKTKLLTFLLAPTFLFLFSGSVFGQETAVKKESWGRGKIKKSKILQRWKDRRFFHDIASKPDKTYSTLKCESQGYTCISLCMGCL